MQTSLLVMNYKKQYIKLIRKAQQNPLPVLFLDGVEKKVYTEKHHIFPKSIFGENKSIIKLTAKEHFVAHLLLWKYYQKKYGNKDKRTGLMCFAIFAMKNNPVHKKHNINSRIYSILRTNYGKLVTIRQTGQKRHFSEEHKKHLSESKIGITLSEEHKKKIGIKSRGRNSKLTKEIRNKIFLLSLDGYTTREIAAIVDLSKSNIHSILTKQTWGYLDE